MLPRTTTFLLAFFLLFICSAEAQTTHKKAFASRALIGLHFGYYRSWEESWNNRYEISRFWGPRAGISITERLYAGVQARIISARNFETPWQNFYMAGLWGRGYIMHPALSGSANRLGVFLETGLMLGNYSFDNRDFIEYYIRRSGQWYIPVILGAEFRLVQNVTAELCMQAFYNIGRSWDQYSIGYASIGLNYHLGN